MPSSKSVAPGSVTIEPVRGKPRSFGRVSHAAAVVCFRLSKRHSLKPLGANLTICLLPKNKVILCGFDACGIRTQGDDFAGSDRGKARMDGCRTASDARLVMHAWLVAMRG